MKEKHRKKYKNMKIISVTKRVNLILYSQNTKSISRLAFGICCPFLMAICAIYLYRYGNPFFCPVKKFTELYCPGCGSGRSAYYLIHGNIIKALRYNALFVLFFPFAVYYLLKFYVSILFKKEILPFFCITQKMSLVITMVLIIFTVARNIPLYPFSILAP